MRNATQLLTVSSLCGLLAILAASGILQSCGKGAPLEYPEAMNLLRDNNTSGITLRFSATPPDRSSAAVAANAYDELAENHVLECGGPTKLCVPGAAGVALQQDSATSLILTAGHWAPATINFTSTHQHGVGGRRSAHVLRAEPALSGFRKCIRCPAHSRFKPRSGSEGGRQDHDRQFPAL